MAPLPAIFQKRLLPSRMCLGRSFDEPKTSASNGVLVDGSYPNRDGRGLVVFRAGAAEPAVDISSAPYFGVAMFGCRTLGQIRGRGSIHPFILHLDPETAIDHG